MFDWFKRGKRDQKRRRSRRLNDQSLNNPTDPLHAQALLFYGSNTANDSGTQDTSPCDTGGFDGGGGDCGGGGGGE